MEAGGCWRVLTTDDRPAQSVHVTVVGAGATGAHTARALLRLPGDHRLTLVDRDGRKAQRLAASLGGNVSASSSLATVEQADAVVLCVPAGVHAPLTEEALARNADVVSIADAVADVQALCALQVRAAAAGRRVVVGAGFSPGLSCVLARHAAARFDEVTEISVAKSGTGGPDCARQHHRALVAPNWEWRDGRWVRRRGSSGRRLAWFPDLIGPRDCYRAGLPEPFLLQRAFPEAQRITARMAATRRDRLTGWLPMLRPPHADGGPGGLLVEVWGRRSGVSEVVVFGAADHPALVAGAVAAVTVQGIAADWFPVGVSTLAQLADSVAVLGALHDLGVRVSTFEGAA